MHYALLENFRKNQYNKYDIQRENRKLCTYRNIPERYITLEIKNKLKIKKHEYI